MAKKVFHLTAHGKRELEEELAQLLSDRPNIAQRIATAREFGDLSENAEYSAARELQSRAEARISEIQNILGNSDMIKENVDGKISLGDSVTLLSDGKKYEFKVVSAVEADPTGGKLSYKSPLGEQLLGKSIGDAVTIETPKGKKIYEIVEISE